MRLGRPLVPLELTTEEQTLLESWAAAPDDRASMQVGPPERRTHDYHAATARPSLTLCGARRGDRAWHRASAIAVTAAGECSGF